MTVWAQARGVRGEHVALMQSDAGLMLLVTYAARGQFCFVDSTNARTVRDGLTAWLATQPVDLSK